MFSRCRCDFINLPAEVTIKNEDGKVVKRLRARGAQHLNTILYWIWRDLFVCILEGDSEHHKKLIPEMLDEIEQVYGFPSLQRILYGGKRGKPDSISSPARHNETLVQTLTMMRMTEMMKVQTNSTQKRRCTMKMKQKNQMMRPSTVSSRLSIGKATLSTSQKSYVTLWKRSF